MARACYVPRLKVSDDIGRRRHHASQKRLCRCWHNAYRACIRCMLQLTQAEATSCKGIEQGSASGRQYCIAVCHSVRGTMHAHIDTNVCLPLFCLLMQPLQASADAALSRPIIDFFSLVASTLFSRGRTSITLVANS